MGLGKGINPESVPSKETTQNAEKLADILNNPEWAEYYQNQVILLGGHPAKLGSEYNGSSEASEIQLTIQQNTQNQNVAYIKDEESTTTFENIANFAGILKDLGSLSTTDTLNIDFVSSKYHARRASLLARLAFKGANINFNTIDSGARENYIEKAKGITLAGLARIAFVGIKETNYAERAKLAQLRYDRIVGVAKFATRLPFVKQQLRGYGN